MSVGRKIISSTVLLLLFAVAVVGVIIVPTVMKIKELTAELTGQYTQIERRYVLRNYVKQTQDDIALAQTQFDKIRRTSIQEGQELQFIQALENAASISDVEQEISLETVNETELNLWEKEIPLRIKISGPFPGVMSWLNEVEHFDYYVLFDSIRISSQWSGGFPDAQGRVDAQFHGKVYWVSKEAPYFLDFHDLPLPSEQPIPVTDDED